MIGKIRNLSKYAVITFGLCPLSAFADYTAVLSCGMNGGHLNIAACFIDTELKITSNGRTGVYKVYNLNQVGREFRDGLHIRLSESFRLLAQNSDDTLTLGITITDENGQQVYQDMVGRYGVINVGN